MEALRQNLAPDASDAELRGAIAFFGLHRSHLALDAYLSRFEMARRRARAQLPNDGMFPDITSSSLRLQNAGLTPNRKSMILSSMGGDPSLEAMKRHTRRISQPCGMEMKQDVRVATGDLLKTNRNLSMPGANKALGGATVVGDAQVAPKKKKGKRKWARAGPPQPLRRRVPCQTRLIPVRVTATGALDAGANSICSHIAEGNNQTL